MIDIETSGKVRVWDATFISMAEPTNIVIHMTKDELFQYANDKGFDIFRDAGSYLIFLQNMTLTYLDEEFEYVEEPPPMNPV